MADDPPRGKPAQPSAGASAQGDGDPGDRMDEESAGYMELEGAGKDADCSKVEVDGGISSELGCCNEFEPNDGADAFKCGNCRYVSTGREKEKINETVQLQGR